VRQTFLRAAAQPFCEKQTMLLAMFGLGPTELIVLAIVVLLLFGSRLPSVMRSLGRGVVEFKKGVQGIEDDLDENGNPLPASKRKLDEQTREKSEPTEKAYSDESR